LAAEHENGYSCAFAVAGPVGITGQEVVHVILAYSKLFACSLDRVRQTGGIDIIGILFFHEEAADVAKGVRGCQDYQGYQ